jgi:dephospho-CoA kinase
MVYCIGLIGNIASGKTTVACFFQELGIEIISADAISRQLTAKNEPAFCEIIKHFGKSVIQSNGELNRRHLRELIFKHKEERSWLENLLHPMIREQIKSRLNEIKSPYCFIEIPLFSSKENYDYLNRILLVKANPDDQITRFIARDKGTKEDALAILSSQTAIDKHLALADDIIENTGSLEELRQRVLQLHKQYYQQASGLDRFDPH